MSTLKRKPISKKSDAEKLLEKLDAKIKKELISEFGGCQNCGTMYGLTVHHIMGRRCKKLRHDRSNLILLCWRCHDPLQDSNKNKAMCDKVFGEGHYDELKRRKFE